MADERIAWYSQPSKNAANNTDKVMVYDGTNTYMVPISAILALVEPSEGGSTGGESPAPSTNNWYDAPQKLKPENTDLMPVYDGSDAYVVPISSIKGADNLKDDYVLLTGEDGVNYRVKIDVLGNAKVIKDSAYTATAPNESDNTNDIYQALIINQMWGGGDALTGTSFSHSFIELYNLSNK